jgi:hypothetical protein
MDDPAGRERRVPRSEPATALLHHMASLFARFGIVKSALGAPRRPLTDGSGPIADPMDRTMGECYIVVDDRQMAMPVG